MLLAGQVDLFDDGVDGVDGDGGDAGDRCGDGGGDGGDDGGGDQCNFSYPRQRTREDGFLCLQSPPRVCTWKAGSMKRLVLLG